MSIVQLAHYMVAAISIIVGIIVTSLVKCIAFNAFKTKRVTSWAYRTYLPLPAALFEAYYVSATLIFF